MTAGARGSTGRPPIIRLVGADPRAAETDPRALEAFPGEWLAPWLRACRRLDDAGYGASVVRAYRAGSIAAAALVGPEPAIDLADAVSAVTIKAGRRAGEALSAAARPAAARLADGRRFRDWFNLMQRLAAMAPESAFEVFARTDELLARLTVGGLESWCLAGVRQGGGDREKRRAFFSLETPDAERLLDLEAGDAGFFDRERRHRAFQRALFALAPPVREAPPGRHDGARRRASFGGGVIRMPASFPGFRAAQGAALQRAAMAHIGAHLSYSGPPFPIGKLKPLQVAVVSLIEDARVEALAMREMPGLIRLWLPFHVAQASGVMSAPSLFARLARALIDPDFHDIDGWVRKGRDLFHAAADRWEDPSVSRAIGNLLGNDLGQMRVQFNAKTYAVEPPYRDDNLGLWEPDETSPPDPETAEAVVESVRLTRQDDRPADTERPDDAEQSDAEGGAPVALVATDMAIPVARLPEWDYQARRERPDWTLVLDTPARLGPLTWLDELYDRRGDVARRLDRLVAAARTGRPQRLRRQAEGETLDLDATIDAAVSLRSGVMPDGRVFQSTGTRQRDLAVSVLLDVSQSTSDRLPSGRSVLAVEREAVALLAHAMAGAQDPFEILAFQSNGREEVRLLTLKAWSDPFGRVQGARLAGLQAQLSTRLGAALRWVGRSLSRRAAHRRLVLLVTDGEPSDIDCSDPRYLVEDARHAVHGLGRLGIDCFCVAVGRQDRAVLDRIFGARNHVTVATVEALPEKLPMLYLGMTR